MSAGVSKTNNCLDMDPISNMKALLDKCEAAYKFEEQLVIAIEIFKYALENEFIDAYAKINRINNRIKFYRIIIAKQAELKNTTANEIGDDIDELMDLCDRVNAKYSQLLSACVDNDV